MKTQINRPGKRGLQLPEAEPWPTTVNGAGLLDAIDEADTFLQGNDELRGILNAGYSRETAYVVRVSSQAGGERSTPSESGQASNPERGGTGAQPSTFHESGSRLAKFSCWCPKMMAAIGRLPETLADRCIMITMQRKKNGEQCERLRNLNAEDLGRRCGRFVEDHAEKIQSWQPTIPEKLNDRAADIWEPLLVLADLAGGDWPARARAASEKLSEREEENSHIGLLLIYIQAMFRDSKEERFFSRTIVQVINQFENRPWEDERKGKPIDELWLARQLRPYGIQPRTVWINGQTAKGYHREDFADLLGRYGPPIPEDLTRWLEGGEWKVAESVGTAENVDQLAEVAQIPDGKASLSAGQAD